MKVFWKITSTLFSLFFWTLCFSVLQFIGQELLGETNKGNKLYFSWLLISYLCSSFFGGMIAAKLSRNQDFQSAPLLFGLVLANVFIAFCCIKSVPFWLSIICITSTIPLSIMGGKRVRN